MKKIVYLKRFFVTLVLSLCFAAISYKVVFYIKSPNKVSCYMDCETKDISNLLADQFDIASLNNEKYKDIILDYSYFSAYGSFHMSATYIDNNGKEVRLRGSSFDVDKSNISWPLFGDASIFFKDGKIFLKGDKTIFKSSVDEFSEKVNKAAYILKLYANKHDDDLKPVQLMDGTKAVK